MDKSSLYFTVLPREIFALVTQYQLRNCSPDVSSLLKIFNTNDHLVQFLVKSKLSLDAFKSPIANSDQKSLATILACDHIPSTDNDDYHNIILFNAVRSNNPSMIKLLLYLGANIEFQNKDPHDPKLYHKTHYTLLAHATEFGYIEATQILLNGGADPNPHSPAANKLPIPASPLICALKGNTKNTPAIVTLLLQHGTQINLPDAYNQTALSFLYANPALANARKAHEILKTHEGKKHHY